MVTAPRVRTWIAALGMLSIATATDILSTDGFQDCGTGVQDVTVTQFQLSFDRTTNELVFAVAGDSLVSQNVTGWLSCFHGLICSSSKCVGSG
jgi:hypothetical protein